MTVRGNIGGNRREMQVHHLLCCTKARSTLLIDTPSPRGFYWHPDETTSLAEAGILHNQTAGTRAVDVFIHSSAHSGSTWLGYVLGSSSESAFVGELYRAWNEHVRVPCTVCASRGLSECTLLYGIEDTEPRDVFSLISDRSGKRIIVDSSKSIEWTKLFVDRPDRDLHIVHVVKDPRGRWASLRRREAGQALEESLATWCAENREIRDFAAEYQLPMTVVSYDIVAANQQREIPELFAFLGSRFEPAALRYWEVDHHGFAANGASSALIEHQKFTTPPKHFATADDSFYQNMFGRTFVDERWRTELPEAEIAAITTNPGVKTLLTSLGLRLTRVGMERLEVEGTAASRSVRSSSWMPRIRRAVGLS